MLHESESIATAHRGKNHQQRCHFGSDRFNFLEIISSVCRKCNFVFAILNSFEANLGFYLPVKMAAAHFRIIYRRVRRLCSSTWINLTILSLAIILLIWTVRLYWCQKLLRTETILAVLGHDRNTSASVLPLVNTVLLEPTHRCLFEGRDTKAIIMVPSLPERRDRRENIRTTWGGYRYTYNVLVYFVVGKLESGNYSEIIEEAKLHGDLIVENLDENYYGLTTKTLRMLKWFNGTCPSSRYFIKADDDVYVNLQLLTEMLERLPEDFQIGGRVLFGRTPNLRNPFTKWYTPPELWGPNSIAPPYIGGPFYVIKGSFVPTLLKASYRVPLYHFEDVFISGMVAAIELRSKLYELPGMWDPKFPWMTYLWERYFSWQGVEKTIVSFHTDGDMKLVRRMFRDIESAQVYL